MIRIEQPNKKVGQGDWFVGLNYVSGINADSIYAPNKVVVYEAINGSWSFTTAKSQLSGGQSFTVPYDWNGQPGHKLTITNYYVQVFQGIAWVRIERTPIPPTLAPSQSPTLSLPPSMQPSESAIPSAFPSASPSINPTSMPSIEPSYVPSIFPSGYPTMFPSPNPSLRPTTTRTPTSTPSVSPSLLCHIPPSFTVSLLQCLLLFL